MKKICRTHNRFVYWFKPLIIILASVLSISFIFAEYGKNSKPSNGQKISSGDPIKFAFLSVGKGPESGLFVFIENENENENENRIDNEQWIKKFKQAGQDIPKNAYDFTLDNHHLADEFKPYPLKKYTLFFKKKSIPMKFKKLSYSYEFAYQLFTIQLEPDTPSPTDISDKEKYFVLEKPHPPIQTSQVSEIVTITPSPKLAQKVKQRLKKHFSQFLKKNPRNGILDTTDPNAAHLLTTPGKIDWFTIKTKPNYKFIVSVWHDDTDTDDSYTFAVVGVFLLIENNTSIELSELIPLRLEGYPCLEIIPYAYLKINNRQFIQVEKKYLENYQNHIYEISTSKFKPWKHHSKSYYYGL